MNNYVSMKLSVFKNFWDKQPTESTLDEMVRAIQQDERTKVLTMGYRQEKLASMKDESMLFAVPCIFNGGKAHKDVVGLTGLGMVDFDHVATLSDNSSADSNEDLLQTLKRKIINDPHTLLCYTTISGEGLRVLFRYDLDETFKLSQQIQFYKKAFLACNTYYEQLLGISADEKCKNVTRLTVVAHDPDVYYNPDAEVFALDWIGQEWEQAQQRDKQTRRRNRELLRIRSLYDKAILPEISSEGAIYAPGNHNDYVMRVGYLLNQYGISLSSATEWAVSEFPDYERTADVIASCYEKTEEHGSRAASSRSPYDKGEKFASVEDIEAYLSANIRLRRNIITCRTEWCKNGNEHWIPVNDTKVNSLWKDMSRAKRVNIQDFFRIIESDFVPEYHPFKEYLKELDDADGAGEDYIRQLASTVKVKGGEAEQELFSIYLKKWLVAMVAAWVDDSVVNNVILVLIGEQGSYKTTWFNYLLPPRLKSYFYTKTNANRMTKDDLMTLAQYGLVCCEELDTMSPKDLNQLKAAVTMPSIDERAAYAHYHEHRAHIASFCGTGNNVQFLSDPTGNRRWLPFEVEQITNPRLHPFNYQGIYSQAYRLYKSGFRYWFSKEDITRLTEHNRQFETPRLEHELVQLYFRKPGERESGEFMSVALAMQIIGIGITQKLSTVSLGRAFVEQGFQRKTYRNTRGYIVIRRTAEEMRSVRFLMAHDSTPETPAPIHTHTDDTAVF